MRKKRRNSEQRLLNKILSEKLSAASSDAEDMPRFYLFCGIFLYATREIDAQRKSSFKKESRAPCARCGDFNIFIDIITEIERGEEQWRRTSSLSSSSSSRKVKFGSADRLGALVAYDVCTRCLLMAARLKRVVTRACQTKIDVKQNVQTYIHSPPLRCLFLGALSFVCAFVRPFVRSFVSLSALAKRLVLRQRAPIIFCCVGIMCFITYILCVFSIYQAEAGCAPIAFVFFDARGNKHATRRKEITPQPVSLFVAL